MWPGDFTTRAANSASARSRSRESRGRSSIEVKLAAQEDAMSSERVDPIEVRRLMLGAELRAGLYGWPSWVCCIYVYIVTPVKPRGFA